MHHRLTADIVLQLAEDVAYVSFKDCHGPHRRAGAPVDPERQSNETKTPAAEEQVQIDHVLVVRKAHLPADVMDLPVGDMAHAR